MMRMRGGLGVLLLLSMVVPAGAEKAGESLTVAQLRRAGLSLPSYMALPELMTYQEKLPSHQALSLSWGASGTGAFTLVERKQKLAGAPGKSELSLSEVTLVVVAATCSAEVRGLALARLSSESGAFSVKLPDDSRICGVYFLRPVLKGKAPSLTQVGSINLQRAPVKPGKPGAGQ